MVCTLGLSHRVGRLGVFYLERTKSSGLPGLILASGTMLGSYLAVKNGHQSNPNQPKNGFLFVMTVLCKLPDGVLSD